MNEMNPDWVEAVAKVFYAADTDSGGSVSLITLAELAVETLVPLVEEEFKAEMLDAHMAIDDAIQAVREARGYIRESL